MRKLPIFVVTAASLLFALTPAAAILPSLGVTAGITGGSLGVGPELGYKLNPLIGIRGSATFLNVSGHGGIAGYRYSGKLKLSNYGATVDVYPIPLTGFRLSAGARVTSHNRIHFLGTPTGNETYAGVTYTPDQQGSLSGDFTTRSVSPMLTVGYSNVTLTGLTFAIDAGAMFHGHPSVDNLVATGRLATDPNLQARRAEQQQRLRDKVDNYTIYPVVQLSVGYRF